MTAMYDAFVSYSRSDLEWVEQWLLPQLEKALLRVCLDKRDFELGASSLENMENAVENSRKTILILSPEWVASEWTKFESLLAQSSDPAGERRRVIPLILHSCQPPRRLRNLTHADFTDPSKWQTEIKRLIRAIREETLNKLPPSLTEVLRLYLTTCFRRDQFARLDQAGDTDPDRSTLLRQVFIDLDVTLRSTPPNFQPKEPLRATAFHPAATLDESNQEVHRVFSAMDWLIREHYPKTVIIGGPGQGKSTLGQHLSQIHRAALLDRNDEAISNHSPAESVLTEGYWRPRIPIRIILKYLAQWLEDHPGENIETYLANQISSDSSRSFSIDELHSAFRTYPLILIYDGLDEVNNTSLRSAMLRQIQELQDRLIVLEADFQILATSRPTGYANEFDPKEFVHLELRALTPQKVSTYAERWALVKVGEIEERRRVLGTLMECQAEEHSRLLLTTPLQVSIVLLIIKDGGRPPAQREALFNEYWSTIFRRERAKGKGILKSEEALLFNLHATLGYLLHRRAVTGNVRSLLPEQEFRDLVEKYLRSQDRQSKSSSLKKKAHQLVEDARDRLVLLVEPEPGLFGFELRSLQEFFAAAFLIQTARDTAQRFRRVRAIARSSHWRNVVLFCAGRIVRHFEGEAANILELVCRPLDRELSDRHLRRGAWLALDIAVDGAFAANRDLQYSSIEYALSLLSLPLSNATCRRLGDSIRKLPRQDRNDIVRPLLEIQIFDLPVTHLSATLEIFLTTLGARKAFARGGERLLTSQIKELQETTIDLWFRSKADISRLAEQINRHWPTWLSDLDYGRLFHLWQQSPSRFSRFMEASGISREQVDALLSKATDIAIYVQDIPRIKLDIERLDKRGPWEHLVNHFCLHALLSALGSPTYRERKGILITDVRKGHQKRLARASTANIDKKTLLKVAKSNHINNTTKLTSWALAVVIWGPDQDLATLFDRNAQHWICKTSIPKQYLAIISSTWPIFGMTLSGRGTKTLQKFISVELEISFGEEVFKRLQELIQRTPRRDVFNLAISAKSRCAPEQFVVLDDICSELDLQTEDVAYHFLKAWYWRGKLPLGSLEYSIQLIQRASENQNPEQIVTLLSFLRYTKWQADQNIDLLTTGVIESLIKKEPNEYRALAAATLLALFTPASGITKRLVNDVARYCSILDPSQDNHKLSMLDGVLSRDLTIADFINSAVSGQPINRDLLRLIRLAVLSITAVSRRPGVTLISVRKRLNKPLPLSLIMSEFSDPKDWVMRIDLLVLSEFPDVDAGLKSQIFAMLTPTVNADIISAWRRFLFSLPAGGQELAHFRTFLEEALEATRRDHLELSALIADKLMNVAREDGVESLDIEIETILSAGL